MMMGEAEMEKPTANDTTAGHCGTITILQPKRLERKKDYRGRKKKKI